MASSDFSGTDVGIVRSAAGQLTTQSKKVFVTIRQQILRYRRPWMKALLRAEWCVLVMLFGWSLVLLLAALN